MIAQRHQFAGHHLTVAHIARIMGYGETFVRRALRRGADNYPAMIAEYAAGRGNVNHGKRKVAA